MTRGRRIAGQARAVAWSVSLAALVIGMPIAADPPPGEPAAYLLEPKMHGVSIGGLLYLLRDATRKLDLSAVRERDGKFVPATSSSPGFGFSRDAHWARFRIQGGLPERQRLMLEFAMPSLDSIDLYVLSPAGAVRRVRGGDVPDFRHRGVRHRNEVVDLRFPQKGIYLVYIRLASTGAVSFKLKAWDPESLAMYLERERLAFGIYFGIMVAMLMYNLFVFLSIRDLAYLYYVGFIATFVIMQAAIDGNAYQFLWPGGGALSRIGVPVFLYGAVITAGQFTRRFVLLSHFAPVVNRLLLGVMIFAGAGILATIAMEIMDLRTLVLPANLVALVGIGLAIVGAGTALYRGSRQARYYLLGWTGFLAGGVFVILRNVGVIEGVAVLDWSMQLGSAALVMLLSLGLADVINTMRKELQAYSGELEELVDVRTKDLNETLEEVQNLNDKQHGDYYLTSLLANPLGANRAESEKFTVETYVKQYKEFKFKKWESEIGGDICISDTIYLRERRYIAFVNADAMGKSMQGAGGAIVLGAVFSTLVERTRYASDVQAQSPERWLHYTFQELDRVFQSFNGSMLVSGVLGLIEEATGFLYLINAEHPFTVLLRDGVARFVDDQHVYAKLGAALTRRENAGMLTLQLEAGDTLIMGSDGRDDLLLSRSEQSREINEDETMFLRAVEQGAGRMESIREILASSGEFTDDLSLVRIHVEAGVRSRANGEEGARAILARARAAREAEDHTEALAILLAGHERYPDHLGIMKRIVRYSGEQRHYARAASFAERIVAHAPGENQYMHVASVCLKKMKRLEEAADLGERHLLRDARHVPNMLNLAEVYIAAGREDRARQLLQRVLDIEPDQARAVRLSRAIVGGGTVDRASARPASVDRPTR